jgi:hypothetical protein
MERRGHPSGLPDLEDAGLLKFCFKLEADRSRFVTALELLGCHPLEPLAAAAAVPMAAAAAAAASASAMATSSSSFALYYTKTDHFYQDRLGTNIGKALQQRCAFRRRGVIIITADRHGGWRCESERGNSLPAELEAAQVRKRVLLRHFNAENAHFTKTGSGQA